MASGTTDDVVPEAVGQPSGSPRWLVALSVVAIVVVAGWLRLADVDRPDRIYFDETYYVQDARSYLEQGVEAERPAHPPLGKWVIAAGMALAGDRPLGWRVASVVLGTSTVAATMAAARLLVPRWWPALLAGLFVALDGLAFTSSRIGMLDASLAWWVAAGFLLLVIDHRRPGSGPMPGWWRLGAGAAFGCAVATKWSGLLVLPAAVLLAALTDVDRLRAAWGSRSRRVGRGAAVLAVRVGLPLAVVPAVAYVGSYVPWLASYEHTETAAERCEEGRCGTGIGDRLAGFWREQRELVAFHDRLQISHPDRSRAWRWPLLDEPVTMFLERCRQDADACPYEADEQRRIIGLGSPALWWPTLLAVPIVAAAAVRWRWWAGAAAVAFSAGQWAPWLLSPKPGFSFYLIPVVPFAALAVAFACWALRDRGGRLVAAGLAVAAVAAFAFWRPMYVGSVLDRDQVERRAWLASWD